MRERKVVTMNKGSIYITSNDMERLGKLLSTKDFQNTQDRRSLEHLRLELDRAIVVGSEHIPVDAVTMNSRVRLTDLKTGETMVWTLVFPWNANVDEGKISVLAPVGTAIIGCKSQDVVELEVPSGSMRLKIDEILYQPEAGEDLRM
jgi:regulator of nucleoside diphosphate kinase